VQLVVFSVYCIHLHVYGLTCVIGLCWVKLRHAQTTLLALLWTVTDPFNLDCFIYTYVTYTVISISY